MKINNKNFEKKARDILKLTHDEWFVDGLDESKVMNWSEVAWIKKLIDKGYSVTFKKERSAMENKTTTPIWTPQQEIVINQMQGDITVLKGDVEILKQDVEILKQDVAILKQDVAILKQDVAVLKHDMSEVKDDIKTILEILKTKQ